MNNKTYLYRVQHNYHNLGPYAYFNVNVWKNNKLPYTLHDYIKFYMYNSKDVCEYKRFNIDNYKLKRVPTLPNCSRPGPFEDIDLREKMIERMGGFTKDGKYHIYGFDSIIQAYGWFNEPDELKFLDHLGFDMVKLLVNSKNLIVGKSQCVYFPDEMEQLNIVSRINLNDFYKTVVDSQNHIRIA